MYSIPNFNSNGVGTNSHSNFNTEKVWILKTLKISHLKGKTLSSYIKYSTTVRYFLQISSHLDLIGNLLIVDEFLV